MARRSRARPSTGPAPWTLILKGISISRCAREMPCTGLTPARGASITLPEPVRQGYQGDNGPAKAAKLSGPKGIAYSSDGSVYIADTESHTIRRIELESGRITTVIGTGTRGDGPDGDPLQCKLARPHGVFIGKDRRIYIGDSENHRIRIWK